MNLARAERQLRLAGGVGALAVSVMAVLGLVRGVRRTKGRTAGRPYRIIPLPVYVALGLVYVPGIVWLWRPLPLRLPTPARALALALGTLLYAGGLGVIVWGRATLADMYNISSTLGAELFAEHRLITGGPFAWVRHPMYVGALITAAGGLLLYRTWGMLLILLHVQVFCVRARREEQALAAEFGDAWRAYARRVPSGVPGL